MASLLRCCLGGGDEAARPNSPPQQQAQPEQDRAPLSPVEVAVSLTTDATTAEPTAPPAVVPVPPPATGDAAPEDASNPAPDPTPEGESAPQAPVASTSPDADPMDPRCVEAATQGRLVVFLGAGASMIPPTALPSWTMINAAVLHGLAKRAGADSIIPEEIVAECRQAVQTGLDDAKLPPEYFSEVLVNRLGNLYFDVLSVLDSSASNSVHLAVAELAKAGKLLAVVTTNFDLCIEGALRQAGVEPVVWKESDDYDVEALKHTTATGKVGDRDVGAGCLVLKLHGSADASHTVVDTLSQRSVGLGDAIEGVMSQLLVDGHMLLMGYSGLDLAAAPNYLCLRRTRPTAKGWTWLVRKGYEALPAVSKLQEEYGDKAQINYGELPDWLAPLLALLPADRPKLEPRAAAEDPKATMTARIDAWSEQLEPAEAAVALADLVLASKKHVDTAAKLMDPLIASMQESAAAEDAPLRKVVGYAWAANSLAQARGVGGDQDTAVRLNTEALTHLERSIAKEPAHDLAHAAGLGKIADPEVTHLRALEIRARVLRGKGDAIRIGAKSADAFVEAEALFDAGREAFELLPPSSRSLRGQTQCLMGLADTLRARMKPSEHQTVVDAVDAYKRVITKAQSIGDKPLQALAEKNIGICLKAAFQEAEGERRDQLHKESLTHYMAALEVQERIGDSLEMVKSLRGYAGLCGDFDEVEQGLEYAERSRKLAVDIGYRAGEARAVRLLSDLKRQGGDLDAAVGLIRQSLAITRDMGDKSGVGRGLLVLAKLLSDQGNKAEAKQEGEAALALFEEIQEVRNAEKATKFLRKLEE